MWYRNSRLSYQEGNKKITPASQKEIIPYSNSVGFKGPGYYS